MLERRPRARMLAPAAALTVATRRWPWLCRWSFKPEVGFSTISNAPACNASIVVGAPWVVKVEQMMTGVGRVLMIWRKKVMPSMRGISTSSTITSGHSFSMARMANSGSEWAPISSMPASADSSEPTTCRTTAESSTTMALMRFVSLMCDLVQCSR